MHSRAMGLRSGSLRDLVEDARAKVLTVPNAGKVDILGAQDEVIFLEFSTREIGISRSGSAFNNDCVAGTECRGAVGCI